MRHEYRSAPLTPEERAIYDATMAKLDTSRSRHAYRYFCQTPEQEVASLAYQEEQAKLGREREKKENRTVFWGFCAVEVVFLLLSCALGPIPVFIGAVALAWAITKGQSS